MKKVKSKKPAPKKKTSSRGKVKKIMGKKKPSAITNERRGYLLKKLSEI